MIRIDVSVIDRAIEALYPKLRDCSDTIMDMEHDIPANTVSATILIWSRIRYNIVSGGGGQRQGRLWINSDEYQGWSLNKKNQTEAEFQYQILRNIANDYSGTVPNHSGVAPKSVSHNAYTRLKNWGDNQIMITAKFGYQDISEGLTRVFPEYVPVPEDKNPPPLENVLGLPEGVIIERQFKKSVNSLSSLVDELVG